MPILQDPVAQLDTLRHDLYSQVHVLLTISNHDRTSTVTKSSSHTALTPLHRKL
jgi:hypothetical protein